MRLLALTLLACASALATDVQLRTGSYQSQYRITSLTSATPAVVTVKNWQGLVQHDLANGTTIYAHGIPGCHNANGYLKVKNVNQGAGTMQLTDTSDVNFTCAEPYDTVYQSGFLGKVETFTLQPSPRMMVPQSGGARTRSIDPDFGTTNTAAVATGVDAANPAWAGMLASLATKAAACCSEAGTFARTTTNTGDANAILGFDAWVAAAVWAADNSKTTYLDLAKYSLNHVEWMVGETSIYGRPLAADQSAQFDGLGAGADYVNSALSNIAKAYDLVKGQMSAGEKTTFRAKILNGFDGPCVNPMATTPTGTASVTIGTKIVTGTNLGGYVNGGWIYFKTTPTNGSTGAWYKIATADSATQVTLDTNATATITSKNHHLISPWDEGSNHCGLLWLARGHATFFGPRVWTPTTSVGTVAADATTIPVTYTSGFPTPPFYIAWPVSGIVDCLKVTAIVDHDLTVERGCLYSTAVTHAAESRMYWSQNISGYYSPWTNGPWAVTGDWGENRFHMSITAAMSIGLALADEEPRAKTLFQDAFNYYYTLTRPLLQDYWTGFTQGALNYGYHWGRWTSPLVELGALGEYAFDRPNSIFGAHYWRSLNSFAYWANPDSWVTAFGSTSFGPLISVHYIAPLVAAAQTFNAGQPESAWANYYFRNLSGLFTTASFQNQSGGRASPYALMYMADTDTSTDFRIAQPSWKFFTDNEYDYNVSTGATDKSFGVLVSKTDWTSTATELSSWLGISNPLDHFISDATLAPGSYGIKKGSKTLLGDDSNSGAGINTSNVLLTNYVEIAGIRTSGTQPPWGVGLISVGDGGQVNVIDRKIGNANYVYGRGNFTASYQSTVGMTRRHRGILHWKRGTETIIVFDNTAMTSARIAKTRLHYYRADGTTFNLFTRTDGAISFKKPLGADPAMVTTQILFPDAQTPTISDDSAACAIGGSSDYSCTATITWPVVTGAQMFTAHFPSAGTSATLPATTLLTGLDADSVGLEVDNGNNSRAAVFAKSGAFKTIDTTFTTTFAGNGYCFVTDLNSTVTYNVFRGATPHASNPFTVTAGEHSIEFPCDGASTWTVSSGAAPACTITTTSLIGGTVSAAYSQTATTNCTSPTWSVSAGALPTSLSINSGSGAITGTPTVAGSFSFTLQVVGTENTATKALSIDIADSTVQPLIITNTILELGYRGLPYSAGMSATGGTGPYTWSLITPSTCGITITAEGILTGIPTSIGICALAVRVTDSLAVTADASLELYVLGVVLPRFTGGATVSGGVK